jgi:hypothetical protein
MSKEWRGKILMYEQANAAMGAAAKYFCARDIPHGLQPFFDGLEPFFAGLECLYQFLLLHDSVLFGE